jgi:hypothetical protein
MDSPYAFITIAITGAVSGEGLYDPPAYTSKWSASNLWLKKELAALARGGYIIDLRPLAEHPKVISWVHRCPLPDGRIEGEDVDRFPERVRESSAELAGALDREFQLLAVMMATKFGESEDGVAGPFDKVSAAYLAHYWGSKGARIGKRIGDIIVWSDGEQQTIKEK